MRSEMAMIRSKQLAPYQGSILFLEHADTITTTKLHGDQHLRLSRLEIQGRGIEVYETDRGGDVTFHGEGQLVGYPILKLPRIPKSNQNHSYNLIQYLRCLEQGLLKSCLDLGIVDAQLIEGKTGIWVTKPFKMPEKLIAIGVGCSQGISKHGFALNIRTDLKRFTDCIVPCGLRGHGVTSLECELTTVPSDAAIQGLLVDNIRASLLAATGCGPTSFDAYRRPEFIGECSNG